MTRLPVHARHRHADALAALVAALSSPARALTSEVLFMRASGSCQLEGEAAQSLLSTSPPSSSVDVLSFPSSTSGLSYGGLHSYGDTSGNFGSRSSGTGIYDVVGFADGQGMSAGIAFDIRRQLGGGPLESVWTTKATLASTAAGTTFEASGPGAGMFTGTGKARMIQGTSWAVDLGVLNAGESMNLVYDLTSFARGNALEGTVVTVPDRVVEVPEQWVEFCDFGYGYGGYGGYGSCGPRLVPAHEVLVAGYATFEGMAGSSQASSGDPFEFNGKIAASELTGERAGLPPGAGLFVTAAPVPEPASCGLMAFGLAGLGAALRRRRRGG